MRRQWKLHQNAVNLIAAIEVMDGAQEVFGADAVRWRDLFAVDAEGLGTLYLVANIDFGGGVMAGEDDRQPGTKPCGGEFADFYGDFGLDGVRGFSAVENSGRHETS